MKLTTKGGVVDAALGLDPLQPDALVVLVVHALPADLRQRALNTDNTTAHPRINAVRSHGGSGHRLLERSTAYKTLYYVSIDDTIRQLFSLAGVHGDDKHVQQNKRNAKLRYGGMHQEAGYSQSVAVSAEDAERGILGLRKRVDARL